MSVDHVEVLVEEPSTEAALRLLLPRLLGELSFEVYPFQCKQNLLDRLPDRLRGYRSWLPDNWRIVVLVDRDDDDCQQLKGQLEQMALDAGLTTRTAAHGLTYEVVNRLVVEELEAWLFGDWVAVRAAYPKVSANVPRKAGYRDPDAILGGTWEALERTLKRAGYFKGGYRKIEAARAIAQHLTPDQNTSRSFQVFHDALREMVTT